VVSPAFAMAGRGSTGSSGARDRPSTTQARRNYGSIGGGAKTRRRSSHACPVATAASTSSKVKGPLLFGWVAMVINHNTTQGMT
jgi:hypothetical protein